MRAAASERWDLPPAGAPLRTFTVPKSQRRQQKKREYSGCKGPTGWKRAVTAPLNRRVHLPG